MKDRKWDFIPFSYYDRTGMERHLEKRAAQGWLLERMSNLGWYYRRIEPRQIHFTVTYYLRASQFDPEPTEEQKEFHDFCLQSGWKLAAASGQMQGQMRSFLYERTKRRPVVMISLIEVD